MRPYILILAAISLVGCGGQQLSGGPESIKQESDATLDMKLIRGKTTKAEVQALFGPPSLKGLNPDGTEAWIYSRSEIQTGTIVPLIFAPVTPGSVMMKQLQIQFDKSNRVKNYVLNG
jgi:outer membrane protein assembly factor BamE (lipoprotein component of BamABCDE complex)